MIRDNIPAAIKGAAALAEALDTIGGQQPNGDGKTDHDLAKIIVENELPLRELLRFAICELAGHV